MVRSVFWFSSARQTGKQREGLMIPRAEARAGSRCPWEAGAPGRRGARAVSAAGSIR